jgi:hypothetical protein
MFAGSEIGSGLEPTSGTEWNEVATDWAEQLSHNTAQTMFASLSHMYCA